LLGALGVACRAQPSPPLESAAAVAGATADTDLKDFRLRALEARVQMMPEGSERDYFSGMLAVRSGQFDEGVRRLNRSLPRVRESDPKRAAMALEAMATAFRANNQYGDAAGAYAELAERFAGHLDRFPADDAALARILSGTSPQTITWQGPVRLKTSTNPLGSPMADLTVNGVRGSWLLDTGANQSVVTQTFAKKLGMKPLPGVATVGSGLTGLTTSVQVAVLPAMQLGGAILKNVVLVIIADANLRIGSGPDAYQINAILGYPIFRALAAVTFTHGEFLAGDAAEKNIRGTRMYMRGLTPAIECEVESQPFLFTFDTGASSTDLSVRYYEQFRHEASSWKKHTVESAGAGGSTQQQVYLQPVVVLRVGPATVRLKDVSVLPVRTNAGLDVLFGNLGQDFVAGFERFSLDFSTMTFSLGPPMKAQADRE
jgi:predicted aspartyl protease